MERGARALHARLFFVKNPFLEAELRSVAQATGAGGEAEVQAVRSLPAAVCARAAALFGAAAAGAWSRWKERLARFPSVFYSSPTSAYELSHGVFRRLRRKRLLRKPRRYDAGLHCCLRPLLLCLAPLPLALGRDGKSASRAFHPFFIHPQPPPTS